MPKLWFARFHCWGGSGGGLTLGLHCACAVLGIMACPKVQVPSASTTLDSKRERWRPACARHSVNTSEQMGRAALLRARKMLVLVTATPLTTQ